MTKLRNKIGAIDVGALLSGLAGENTTSTCVQMAVFSSSLHAYPNVVSSQLARQTLAL
jgi:hypothetical protein